MLIERHHLYRALKSTGVPFKFGYSTAHWNIIPANNLKPFTPEQTGTLIIATHAIGLSTVNRLVRSDFSSFDVEPGRGFRAYRPANEQLNEEGYTRITGEKPFKSGRYTRDFLERLPLGQNPEGYKP